MAKESKNVRVENTSRTLSCALSPPELAARADRAARLLAQRDARDEEAKAAQKHAKAQIAELESEMRRLSAEIRDRAAFRPVDCEVRFDYRRGVVETFRMDTRKVIDARAMTGSERQTAINYGNTKETPSQQPAPKPEEQKAVEPNATPKTKASKPEKKTKRGASSKNTQPVGP